MTFLCLDVNTAGYTTTIGINPVQRLQNLLCREEHQPVNWKAYEMRATLIIMSPHACILQVLMKEFNCLLRT